MTARRDKGSDSGAASARMIGEESEGAARTRDMRVTWQEFRSPSSEPGVANPDTPRFTTSLSPPRHPSAPTIDEAARRPACICSLTMRSMSMSRTGSTREAWILSREHARRSRATQSIAGMTTDVASTTARTALSSSALRAMERELLRRCAAVHRPKTSRAKKSSSAQGMEGW